MNDEHRAECDKLQTEYGDTERQMRAAIAAEGDPVESRPQRHRMPSTGSGSSCAAGRPWAGSFRPPCRVDYRGGEFAEYAASCGAADGSIPLDLFESDRPVEMRADTTTPTTSTVGVDMKPIQPYVFAQSIAARLGISMPSVGSGSHVETTLTVPLTAGAVTKGAARESSAATLTPITATPRRISARLSIAVEDIVTDRRRQFRGVVEGEFVRWRSWRMRTTTAVPSTGSGSRAERVRAATPADPPGDGPVGRGRLRSSFVATVTGFVDGQVGDDSRRRCYRCQP